MKLKEAVIKQILYFITGYMFSKIIASNNPIGSCPIGTDSIIITDTFLIDVAYFPFIGGVPFDGKLIVDGGIILWSSNVKLTLGTNAGFYFTTVATYTLVARIAWAVMA